MRLRRIRRTFVEVFAGSGALTAAVLRAGERATALNDFTPDGTRRTGFNLLKSAHFRALLKQIKQRMITWFLAPPCKTYSRARRKNHFGCAQVLRSEDHPEGLLPRSQLVQDANLLTRLTVQLCFAQMEAGSPLKTRRAVLSGLFPS